MMHTAGIAMPGISVYRLAADAATGAAAGDGLLPSGKRGPCGTGVPERTACPLCGLRPLFKRRYLFALFLRFRIEQAAQCRRVQRVEVEAHPGFVQKGG